MHDGSGMLDYYRDYFANFPDVIAEDSEYVHWGNAIGGDENSTPPGWGASDEDDTSADGTTDGTDDSTDTAPGGDEPGHGTDGW